MSSQKWEKLLAKIYEFPKETQEEILKKSMRYLVQRISARAKELAPANDGELRQSIRTITTVKDGKVTGKVYSRVKHAVFVEFGTGPKGKNNHSGTSPHVNVSYRSKPWWINGSDISTQVAEKYHFPKSISAKGEVFYWTNGQKAQPFIYPALEGIAPDIQIVLSKAVVRAIRRIIKKEQQG